MAPLKFAVVEYSSKTGTVWRHTPERPNYLADPHTEMDPTSFGCYVSALAGEHIPLTGLVVGPINPMKYGTVVAHKTWKRLTGHWPTNYSLDYFSKFDTVLIVHQISDGHEVTKLTQRLRAAYPKLFIMGVPTQPYGILKDYWETHPDWLADFKLFLNTCHVCITIVADTKPFWEALTSTPVVYVPQPYPVEYAQQFYRPRREKQPIILVAGVTARDNIPKGFTVAKQIQQRLPETEIHVIDTPGEVLDLSLLREARVTIEPFTPWREHLAALSQTALVINTDYTYTRGRVQVDCAAVGTVSLGANSDGQRDLFPDLFAEPVTPVQELVDKGVRVLTDARYYEQLTQHAQKRLATYAYDRSRQRIEELRHTQ